MQLESVHHIQQLKADIQQYTTAHLAEDRSCNRILVHRLESLATEGQRVANEERMLKSLEFDECRTRFNDVHEAHAETFDWMLEGSGDPQVPHAGFKEWLRSSKSIFWISGKPGSGKSTLMKFLSKNPKVRHYLQDWAGDAASPVIASWFFWAAGTPMQRSQEGLCQSLLSQILRRCPELLPIVRAERWEDQSAYGTKTDPWSLRELDVAFGILAQQTIPSKRFCLFIDGLDEYDGLPADVIRRIQLLSRSDNIKLCLSSRPWTAFETAFRNVNSIWLQNHTKPDIKRFVEDILEKDKSFTQAERKDIRYRTFVHEVIERAQGVFLWVYLVVNELLKGLGEENKLEDLEDKLNALPDSLEEYFRRIFNGVDKVHQTESAKVFLLTAYAGVSLPAVCYHFLEKEHRAPGYALKATIQPFTSKELTLLHKDVHNRLNFLCKNLLEVQEVLKATGLAQERGSRVVFIHRTVRDFLMTKDMHEVLIKRATEGSQPGWNAHVALCQVLLARIKSLDLHEGTPEILRALYILVDALMFHAQNAENEEKRPETKLLDQLHNVISLSGTNLVKTEAQSLSTDLDENTPDSFLGIAAQSGLILYVKGKLDSNPKLLHNKRGRPLLDYALRPERLTGWFPQPVEFVKFDMVRMLLAKGADPNQKVSLYGGLTVWGLFLLWCRKMEDTDDSQAKDLGFETAKLMIRQGANRSLRLKTKRRQLVRSGPDEISYTAKYQRPVQLGVSTEIYVPVELTAIDIMKEFFVTNKIAEIEAIVPEGKNWSIWDAIRWN